MQIVTQSQVTNSIQVYQLLQSASESTSTINRVTLFAPFDKKSFLFAVLSTIKEVNLTTSPLDEKLKSKLITLVKVTPDLNFTETNLLA